MEMKYSGIHLKNCSHVRVMGLTDISLKETLSPWWKLTRCFGILCNWCHRYEDNKYYLVNIIRYITIGVHLFVMLALTVFEFFRLAVTVFTMTSIHAIIPFFVWFVSFPVTLFSQFYYLYYRDDFLSFFEEWSDFEKELSLKISHHSVVSVFKKTKLKLYVTKFFITMGVLSGLTIVVTLSPEAPYLISYYPVVRDVLTVSVTGTIHIANLAVILLITSLCDAVPSIVFYHFGLEVRVLKEEIEQVFTVFKSSKKDYKLSTIGCNSTEIFSTKLRQLWRYYEKIRKCVERANSLYGVLIFLNHGMKFFVILTMLYSVFHQYKIFPEVAAINFAILMGNLFDFTYCTLLNAELYCASERLRAALGSLLSEHWDSIPKDERDVLVIFLSRLQTDPLAANPVGMYKVMPSILLTLISLTVSYVVILLQSN